MHKKRSFVKGCGIILLAGLGFSGASAGMPADERPNIILILADDMGYGDLGCYGQQMIRTPNIDALARSGIRFTGHYTGSTVCAPSREAMLTGKHTGHTAIRGNFLTDEKEDPPMPPEKVTVAELLNSAGYRTGLIGKWGLGGERHGPGKQGFDYCYGYLDQIQAHNYYPPFLYENGVKVMIPANADGKEGAYSHHLFMEKTMHFLDGSEKGQPFFLYLPYTIPHGKHVIPDNSAYADKSWPEQMKNYAAMISLLDADIGRIVKMLKEKGMDRNTLIIFTSDNGANPAFAKFFKSNGASRGQKTSLYEGGIRGPLIASWPGKIAPGTVSAQPTAAWDLLPTICEAAGIKAPADIDGISLYGMLRGQPGAKEHPYFYWEFYAYNYDWNKPGATRPRNWLDSRALRLGKWKAVVKSTPEGKDDPPELYDLEKDPSETKDVAAANPAVVKEMQQMMAAATRADAPYFPYKK